MTISTIKETLQAMGILYKFNSGTFFLEYNGIEMSINKDSSIRVPRIYFGNVPHIMKDGSVCVFSGVDSIIISDENFELKETIVTYIPYLFGLTGEQKAGEILLELEYYIVELLNKQCSVVKEDINRFNQLEVVNPQNLWETLEDIELDYWYKIFPVNLKNEYVFLKKTINGFQIKYDEGHKAKLRVAGDEADTLDGKTIFIGMGSVNSYVLKTMFSMGIADITIIDDDKIETGNLFRHAFPYRGMYKIDAAERFLQFIDQRIRVKKIYKKISYLENNKSLNYVADAQRIIVSVDNFFSWIQIHNYIADYAQNDCEIIFIGIDTYGNYGKFFKVKYNDKKELFNVFKKFIIDVPEGSSRKNMVGNGCGESLAIYDEQNITSLIREMSSYKLNEEVQYVYF